MRENGRTRNRRESKPSGDSRAVLGRKGEAVAVRHLRRLGYRILKTGFRTRFGEIDIIAEEKDTLVFVEVKTRRDLEAGDPVEAVDGRKQRRLVRLADAYLQQRGTPEAICRFDVVSIVLPRLGRSRVDLYRNAFSADDPGHRNS